MLAVLYLRSHSFGHYRKLLTRVLNHRSTGKSQALPSNSALCSPQEFSTTPSLLLMLHQSTNRSHLHLKKTPRCLNSFTWSSNSIPTVLPPFSGREPWHTWRCWLSSRPLHTWLQTSERAEANRTTSSAKSRGATLRSPNRALSSSRLHLEILSMKITNRIGDKGQPGKALGRTPTENVFHP